MRPKMRCAWVPQNKKRMCIPKLAAHAYVKIRCTCSYQSKMNMRIPKYRMHMHTQQIVAHAHFIMFCAGASPLCSAQVHPILFCAGIAPPISVVCAGASHLDCACRNSFWWPVHAIFGHVLRSGFAKFTGRQDQDGEYIVLAEYRTGF